MPRTPDQCRVLVYHHLFDDYGDVFETRFPDLDLAVCRKPEDLAELIASHRPEAVLAFKLGNPFPRETLVEAPSVRWVQVGSIGIDHIMPWDPDRVTVTNSPVHRDVMSEFALCGVLMLNLGMPRFIAQQARREWRNHDLPSVMGETIAVIGFGGIGQGLGRRAKAIGMRVIGVRVRPEPSADADEVRGLDRLHETLGEADVVALTLPLTAESRNLFDAGTIAACKPGARFVNVARGGIVDEDALSKAVASGALGAVFSDVFATEPLPADSPLWAQENVIVTPHTGDRIDWQRHVASHFCDNLERWMADKPVLHVTDPARGY